VARTPENCMLSLPQLSLFVAGVFVLVIVPGPNSLYLIARSVSQGRMAGLASALGIATATLIHISAAALGLSALLLSSAVAFSIVKYLGAAYLIFLGVCKLLARDEESNNNLSPQETMLQVFSQGFAVNLLNPKTALFFFAFLPQFVNANQGNVTMQILLLGLILVGIGATIDVTYVLVSSHLAGWLGRDSGLRRRQRYLAGSVYIGLGLATALSGSKHG
jgi:threonine/homoserine/homoserine lactone efflux protein